MMEDVARRPDADRFIKNLDTVYFCGGEFGLISAKKKMRHRVTHTSLQLLVIWADPMQQLFFHPRLAKFGHNTVVSRVSGHRPRLPASRSSYQSRTSTSTAFSISKQPASSFRTQAPY